MKKILVSACLLGIPCRYDGKSMPNEKVMALKEKYTLIPVCPEIYGGLPTPRTPSERVGDLVLMKDGTDVTENYNRGADATLKIAEINGAKIAILKAKSPSCGKRFIYDGTFSGTLTAGDGVTAEKLTRVGITLLTENEVDEIL
ncbi:MAG: DUF523 domain-containing protein [Clostridia bacterium]|nr:DUF523 domain-containing protein [Clostridia bacterium]